jgi:phage regulator Rha-like protein
MKKHHLITVDELKKAVAQHSAAVARFDELKSKTDEQAAQNAREAEASAKMLAQVQQQFDETKGVINASSLSRFVT